MNIFIQTITSPDPQLRNRSFFDLSRHVSSQDLYRALRELDDFR